MAIDRYPTLGVPLERLREYEVFHTVYLGLQFIDRSVHGDCSLDYDRTCIELRGYQMNGTACHPHTVLVSIGYGCGALETGQQRRVEIQDPPLIGVYEHLAQYAHPTGKRDCIDIIFTQCLNYQSIILSTVSVSLGRYYLHRYPEPAGSLYHTRILLIGKNYLNPGIQPSLTYSLYYGLGVSSVS